MSPRRLSRAERAELDLAEARARAQRAREVEQLRERLRDADRREAALRGNVKEQQDTIRDQAQQLERLAAALELAQAEAVRLGEIAAVAGRCRAQLHDLLEVLDQVDADPELLHDRVGRKTAGGGD